MLTPTQMREHAKQLEAYADECRSEGFINGPHGAADAEMAAKDWRDTADAVERDGSMSITPEDLK